MKFIDTIILFSCIFIAGLFAGYLWCWQALTG